MTTSMTLNGRVHGQTIEFDDPLPCVEGEHVLVTLVPVHAAASAEPLRPGEGLRRAYGAWAKDGDELDRFVSETHSARRLDRPEIEP